MSQGPRLVADIGGTNARFAIAIDGKVQLDTYADFQVKEHVSFNLCLSAYLDAKSLTASDFSSAVASVAGPVIDNTITFTNNHWRIEGDQHGFKLINDFEAMAYAASTLSTADVIHIGGASLSNPKEGARLSVLGPGTGLGVANGLWAGGLFHPLAGEGGHVTCGAYTDLQRKTVEQIGLDLAIDRVSAERIISGPGLLCLYRALCKLEGFAITHNSPKPITEQGLKDSGSIERRTLELFCEFLGICAGDLALTFGSKHGVFLTGGVTDALADFLPQSGFRGAFENKGRLTYFVEDIPTAIMNIDAPGLRGAAVAY